MDFTSLSEVSQAVYDTILNRGESYVYPKLDRGGTCNYVKTEWDDEADEISSRVPDCLIGQFAYDQNIASLEDMEGWDGNGGVLEVQATFEPFHGATREVLGFLATIQSYQDSGDTWGDAYKKALDPEIPYPDEIEESLEHFNFV